jgi:hypothetical protein
MNSLTASVAQAWTRKYSGFNGLALYLAMRALSSLRATPVRRQQNAFDVDSHLVHGWVERENAASPHRYLPTRGLLDGVASRILSFASLAPSTYSAAPAATNVPL